MEIELATDNDEQRRLKQLNPNTYVAQAAPLAQQEKGIAGQMGDMAKQRLMSGALDAGQEGIMKGIGSLTPSAGALNAAKLASTPATMGMGGAEVALTGQALAPAAGGMAAIGTAMPYVGAALLADKALGLGITDKLGGMLGLNSGGQVGPLSPQYHAEGTMSKEQAIALMNNQPDPDQLYDEIVAESMTEAAQGQMPQYQTMLPTQKVMPMIGPLSVDPMGADTTYDAEMYKQINT